MKKYNIVYADPPWSFSSKEIQKYNGNRFTSMEKHYKTQNRNWINNLSVSRLTADDCSLFLWSTDAHLGDAIETMKFWGFKYITVAFVWEKLTATGKTVCNLGSWTMKNYELCLFGTKGQMLKYKKRNNIRQKVVAERTKHSKKPDKVRELIVELFGDLPRIELFAREKTEGWDVWGDEVDSDIEMPAKKKAVKRKKEG